MGKKDEKNYNKYYQKEALRSACKLESYKKVHKSSWFSSSTSVEVESGWRNRREVEVYSSDDKAPPPGTKTMTEKELKKWKKNKKKKRGEYVLMMGIYRLFHKSGRLKSAAFVK